MAEPRQQDRGGTFPPPSTPPEEPKEPSSTYQVAENHSVFSENFGKRYSGDLVVCTDKEAKSWGDLLTRVGDEKELARREEKKKQELEARLQQGV